MSLRFAHPSWIEIDLSQFRNNISLIRSYIGDRLLCLPVKANAYGHGLTKIGKIAEECKVDYLGVAYLQEGIQLRHAGVSLPILVLGAVHEDQIQDLIKYELEISVSSLYKANFIHAIAKEMKKKCRVHLEIDTGMQRTGVRPSTGKKLLEELYKMSFLDVVGVYTHFATSDIPDHPFANEQMRQIQEFFNDPIVKDHNLIRHIANSGALVHLPGSSVDMVRPGILSFGYFEGNRAPLLKEVKPFFSLKAKISYFKVVASGQGISYGHTFTTQKQTRIVTIPVGYGDGYRRSLSNKGSVLIRGKKYPIVGMICMDQFMVDIGEDEAYIGDEVTLIGRQGNEEISLLEIAKICDTIPYEVLCLFNDRIPRVYCDKTRDQTDLFRI